MKVHKKTQFIPGYGQLKYLITCKPFSYDFCIKYQENASYKWNKVTCKACLKYKK